MARPKVVVVGAGISGLVAAMQLQKSGSVDVVLLEAGERVGGRIWSREFGGEKVEMGANWIHGTEGSPLMEIAEKHNLLDLNSGPWGGTRWTGNNQYRMEGGSEGDPKLVAEVKGLYRRLITETHTIGAKETGLRRYKDKNGCEVGVNESVGAYLLKGFIEDIQQRQMQRGSSFSDNPLLGEEEKWEDDWAGAETLAERGRRAVAYSATASASAGPEAQRDDGPSMETERGSAAMVRLEKGMAKLIKEDSWKGFEGADEEILQRKAIFDMRTRLECCISGVDSLEDLSLRSFGEYEEYPGPHITIAKGYSRVVEILASQLQPGTLLFGREVVEIRWSPSGRESLPSKRLPVTIVTSDGEEVEANHVVVTVSLGVLKERAAGQGPKVPPKNLFCPPLPDWKLEVIRRMGFGTVDKIFLQFPKLGVWGENCLGLEVAWNPLRNNSFPPRTRWHGVADGLPPVEDSKEDGLPAWTQKLYAFHPINIQSPVVVSWIAGREAVEMESEVEEKVVQACMDSIKRFFPEAERERLVEPIAVLRTQWGTDPLFRGSYSYVAVGSSGEDIDVLAKPLPGSTSNAATGEEDSEEGSAQPLQILFAGEATHRSSYSNTHGAFHAGSREAQRILKFYATHVEDGGAMRFRPA